MSPPDRVPNAAGFPFFIHRIAVFVGAVLPAAASLIFLTSIAFYYWPYPWPDEALFSSPAAALASGDGFVTPVLFGLIPGMEEATLWNGPVLSVLVSILYWMTGESLHSGRIVSLIAGILGLMVFFRMTGSVTGNLRFRIVAVAILAFDPTFVRASNAIRMDLLSLLMVLIAMDFFMRQQQKSSYLQMFLAGLATGVAGMTHPFSVVLAPLWLIWILPDAKKILMGILGGLIGFFPWAVYIANHFDLFLVQFAAQMGRKPKMFTLWGGDTGGALKVFFSQYGGGAVSILGFALVLLVTMSLAAYGLYRYYRGYRRGSVERGKLIFFSRLFASTIVILSMIVYSSEGWYALYAGPFLLLVALFLLSNENPNESDRIANLRWIPFAAAGGFFFLAMAMIVFKNETLYSTERSVLEREKAIVHATAQCQSLYLRSVPDPYFALRQSRPNMELLEFIPGKLSFPGYDEQRLHARYDKIDCFLLNQSHSWEPILHGYLESNKEGFDRLIIVSPPPLQEHTLWIRKKAQ